MTAAVPAVVSARRRRLRRIALLLGLFGLGVLLAAVGGRASDGSDDGSYRVRVVFDSASFLIPGEQVKVAGTEAGTIESLDLDPDNKAVAIIRITDPAFRPFRADATCSIGLQTLIGEQFVDCKPTQGRAEGSPVPPELPVIRSGPGQGQHLLPVTRTSSPVGIDLVTNTLRQPARERLRLVIAELGAGVAGNGETLRAAIVRANPALQQADRVVSILADQSRTIDRLVSDTDALLGPLAARRADLGASVERIGDVAGAAAERGTELERSVERLPGFLQELEPAARRISGLADQAGPLVAGLSANAPALSSAIRTTTPFAREATPAFTSLGRLAVRGRTTVPRIQSLVDRLETVATPLRPVAGDLSGLLTSLERAGGIESLMRTLYFYSGSINGADGVSHYLRAALQANVCIDRTSTQNGSCRSDMGSGGEVDTAAETRGKLVRQLAASLPVTAATKTRTTTSSASASSGGSRTAAAALGRKLDALLGPGARR